ncbi:MAG TPA: formate dehydrogenase accessory sulfurtransferase FdhD [Mycobacteriales bacterium]|nr:formate dehydrogenase accessory sulfurtransferase FdhD [Mycobacteriales bacterium]
MGRVTERRQVMRVHDGATDTRPDTLVVEEPLEIRVAGRPLSVTMRTPGHDLDLALGFLLTEGLVADAAAIRAATNCADNVVDITLAPDAPEPSADRNFYTTSSCGMCGKASIDAVRTVVRYDVSTDRLHIDGSVLTALPDRLRAAQRVFDRTGALHAAGLFDARGELLCLREDVGRHNAVDKVIGWAAQQDRLPLRHTILQVSGRASFELVQKAVMAGIPCLAAVSAPSSLAVDLAEETGLTLVGFLRGHSYNVYAHARRLHPEPARV